MCKLTDFIEQLETAGTYCTKRIQNSGLSLYLSPTHVESSELLSDWAPMSAAETEGWKDVLVVPHTIPGCRAKVALREAGFASSSSPSHKVLWERSNNKADPESLQFLFRSFLFFLTKVHSPLQESILTVIYLCHVLWGQPIDLVPSETQVMNKLPAIWTKLLIFSFHRPKSG